MVEKMKLSKREQFKELPIVLRGTKLFFIFIVIAGLIACESSIVNNKPKENDDKQERVEYDDMSQLVRYSPFSKNNNNFMVLNPTAYPKASDFVVEIQESKKNDDGNYEFVTIWEDKMSSRDPYLKIPTEFNTKNEVRYAVMISAYDAGGNKIAQGPMPTSVEPLALAEPQKDFYFYSMVTCNGPDYAYNLASYTDHPDNPTKYKIEMLGQRFSPEPNETGELEIQYYQYMDEYQFEAWEQENPPVADPQGPVYPVDVLFPGELPEGNYYNSQNNLITGPVYAVEKDFGPWEGDSSIGEDALSSPYYPHSNMNNWYLFQADFTFNNTQDLIYFSSKINQDIIPEDSRYGTELICKQVGINGGSGSGGTSGTSTPAADASLIYKDCLGNIISSGDGYAGPDSDNVIQIADCGDEGEGEGLGDGSVFGVYSVSFEKIGDSKDFKPITLYPDRFRRAGYTYSLEEGLYDVKVITKDQTVIHYLKKVNTAERHQYDPTRGKKLASN